ncbi:Fibulin-2 [Bagarius yarrelli]|uniref:Fibulin-2 n=1 Tax=Bagarius yarrelli TaxID=175774 RepID=A0A556VXI3_BAGYA|nr:Fibulin-2 [Bagarius yarrelli]
MTERVWLRRGWTTVAFALVLIHVCLGQKDCTGVDCPHLDSCIEEVLEDGGCCATCLQQGCVCKGYQFYDCISAGFKNGKVPEGASYLVDSGSTECRCPAGGGDIKCRFIPCPDVPSHCIELSDPSEACPHCLRIGCVYQHHKYEAGHSFHMDPCQVCHCPNDGGDLMCSVIPDCSLETIKNLEKKEKELQISKYPAAQKPSRNSVLIYTEDTSEFEEGEDYDYFHEVTASPEEKNKDPLSVSTAEKDYFDNFSTQTETVGRHTQVPARAPTPSTAEDIRSDHRNLQHTISEVNTLPKLQFVSTTTAPVKMRKHEAYRQPQTLGRYNQERNDLHLTSHKQRGE